MKKQQSGDTPLNRRPSARFALIPYLAPSSKQLNCAPERFTVLVLFRHLPFPPSSNREYAGCTLSFLHSSLRF